MASVAATAADLPEPDANSPASKYFEHEHEHEHENEHEHEHSSEVLYRKKDGEHRVVAATVNKLLDAVIDPRMNTSLKDIAALVTGSVFFFTAHDFLAMIMRAYSQAKEYSVVLDTSTSNASAELQQRKKTRVLEVLRVWLKLFPGDVSDSAAVGFGLLLASFETSEDEFEREWLHKLKAAVAEREGRAKIVPVSEAVRGIVAAGAGDGEAAAASESRFQSRLLSHRHSSKKTSKSGFTIRSKFSVFVGKMTVANGDPGGPLISGHLLTPRVAPAVLACQITFCDYVLLDRVGMREILRGSWKVAPTAALVDVRDHFQRLVLWFASEIVSVSDTNARAEKLSRILFLAEALLDLNNMHGAFAVHRALRLPCIDRLKKTWKHIHADAQKVHSRLEALFNFEWDAGDAYRSHTEHCLKDKRTAMVPALWIMLEDVERLLAQRSLEHRETNLISFHSLSLFVSLADARRALLRRRYGIKSDEKIQHVLREGLVVAPAVELDRLSHVIEPEPDKTKKLKEGGVRAEPWFYGGISRVQAEQVLSMTKGDSFLIRYGPGRSRADCHIVSLRVFKRNVFVHRLIEPAYDNVKRLAIRCVLSQQDEQQLAEGNRALINSQGSGVNVYGVGRTFTDLLDLVANDAYIYGMKPATNLLGRTLKEELRLPVKSDRDGRDLRLNVSGFDGVLFQRDSPLHLFMWEDIFVNAEQELTEDDLGAALRSDGLRGDPSRQSSRFLDLDIVPTAEALISEGSIDELIEMVRSSKLPAATVFPSLQYQTLLHVAAEYNEPHLIDVLMFDAHPPQIDARDSSFSTALHVACRGGFLTVARSLLAKGASAAALTASGASPLHYAMRRTHSEDPGFIKDLVSALLTKGAAINGPDLDLNTPLFHAVMAANVDGVAALLDLGADPDNRNSRGMNPLDLLAQYELDVPASATTWLRIRQLLEAASDGKPSEPSPIAGATQRFLLYAGSGKDEVHCELERFRSLIASGVSSLVSHQRDPNSSNFIAQDPARGTVWLALSERDGKQFGLVRCKHGDAEFELRGNLNPDAAIRSIKRASGFQFSPFEVSSSANSSDTTPANKALAEADLALQDGVMDFALVFALADAFKPSELMRANKTDHSPTMTAFVDFLGGSGSDTDPQGMLTTDYAGTSMKFCPLTSLTTEERPRKLMKHGVVVVFSEAPQVDTTIFGKLPAPVVVLVRPEPISPAGAASKVLVNILSDHGVRRFVGPRLPRPSLLSLDHGCERDYFLALLAACWHEATRAARPFKIKRERLRERELAKLNTALQMMSSRALSLTAAHGADGKPEAKQGRPADYLLGKELGSGATGKTYTALHKVSREKFCMKVVNLDVLRDTPKIIEQVRLEIDLLSKIRHDNIVRLFESYETPEALFLVIQLCTGGDLQRHVRDNGPYSERHAKLLARQLLSAIAVMRRYSICHRDIKPENLLFLNQERQTLVLCDFGLGKDTQEHALNMTVAGTPDYIAPEILEGMGYDYFKVDDYSSGCVVYFMLFGRPPYATYEPGEMLFTAIISGAVDFKHSTIQVSDDAKEFIRSLMDADPKKRLTAASALAHPWLN